MLKKVTALMLVILLAHLAMVQPSFAGTNPEKEAQFIEKVKAGIVKLGTGKEARVEIKLRDKTKLKGYISEATDDHFVITDAKTGVSTPVAYPQVVKVKGRNNLSGDTILLIGIIAVIALTLIVVTGKNF